MIERHGYRRTTLTFSMQKCEGCGEADEITYLNVVDASNVCRECWKKSTLCTVEYAKVRVGVKGIECSDELNGSYRQYDVAPPLRPALRPSHQITYTRHFAPRFAPRRDDFNWMTTTLHA